MTTKTFKIGEYCKGGVITVEIKGKNINIIGKDWDHSQGSRKSSNQSNAKEFTRLTVSSIDGDTERECVNFLEDLTTSYYAGKVMEWVKGKIKFENSSYW